MYFLVDELYLKYLIIYLNTWMNCFLRIKLNMRIMNLRLNKEDNWSKKRLIFKIFLNLYKNSLQLILNWKIIEKKRKLKEILINHFVLMWENKQNILNQKWILNHFILIDQLISHKFHKKPIRIQHLLIWMNHTSCVMFVFQLIQIVYLWNVVMEVYAYNVLKIYGKVQESVICVEIQ